MNTQTEVSTSSPTDIKAIALRFYPPLRTGDTSDASQYLAEDWHDVPLNQGQTPGPTGFGEMVAKLRAFLPDIEWDIRDVIAESDRVVVRSVVRGTAHAHVLGLNMTGGHVEFDVIDIHQVVNGKISTTWHVEDKMAVMRQFGIPHISFR